MKEQGSMAVMDQFKNYFFNPLDHSQKKQKDSLETRIFLLICFLELEISEVAVESIKMSKEHKFIL